MGSAAAPPVSPLPSFFGWSNPIHETPTIEALNPQNQASTFSLVVPVLPARSLRPSESARVAVPALDLVTLSGGAAPAPPDAYRGPEPPGDLAAVMGHWARVQAHTQYLAFAADHLGTARVLEMADAVETSLAALG